MADDSQTTNTVAGDQTLNLVDETKAAFSGLMKGEVTEATSDFLTKVIVPAGMALLALIVTYFIARLISRWVSASLCKRIDQTLGRFAGRFVFYAIMLIAGLSILQTAGVDGTSFAAVMAAAGFAIGLAFQGTLSNFASGVLLMVFRPFKVGDVINAAGVTGKVNEIDLFTTTLDTPDNRRLIVPNSSISSATIENITHHSERRVDVTIGVAYAASLDDTRNVLEACARSLDEYIIEGDGRGFQVLLSNLGASSVDWTIRFWTSSDDYWLVKEKLTTEVKRQLDSSSIDIPFPQMQLHIADQAIEASNQTIKPDTPLAESAEKAESRFNESQFNETRSNGRIRPRARS